MQLVLKDVLPKSRKSLSGSASNPDFELLLSKIRAESLQILEAACRISGEEYPTLMAVPTELMGRAREQVLGPAKMAVSPRAKSKASRPYRAWSLQRKLGERCRRLLVRTKKRTSLFYFEELQSSVLLNPEYFGVCPLPAEGICNCNPQQRLRDIRTSVARSKEIDLRAVGH